MAESTLDRKIRDRVQKVMSLNVGDLDVEGLERRAALVTTLRKADPTIEAMKCQDLECTKFKCGWF